MLRRSQAIARAASSVAQSTNSIRASRAFCTALSPFKALYAVMAAVNPASSVTAIAGQSRLVGFMVASISPSFLDAMQKRL
jgi:hypothetical protein